MTPDVRLLARRAAARRSLVPGAGSGSDSARRPSRRLMRSTQLFHLMDLSRLMYPGVVTLPQTRETPGTPPSVLRLTGHPLRWQLLIELARSDRQVSELAELIGQRQSLTSYHLGQLRDGGLVTMRRSSADKRDTYYSLDLAAYGDELAAAGAALHPGLRLVPADSTAPMTGPG